MGCSSDEIENGRLLIFISPKLQKINVYSPSRNCHINRERSIILQEQEPSKESEAKSPSTEIKSTSCCSIKSIISSLSKMFVSSSNNSSNSRF